MKAFAAQHEQREMMMRQAQHEQVVWKE